MSIFIFYFSECRNRIYNAWDGPFHLNLEKFITYWKIYGGNLSIERSLLSSLISFDKEYLQIEFGEDKIDDNPLNISLWLPTPHIRVTSFIIGETQELSHHHFVMAHTRAVP